MLRRWLEHYDGLIGRENLYIVSHGNDPKHREIAEGANVLGLPRTGLDTFERTRNFALNDFMRGLEKYYDAIIRADVDEFVFVDPAVHESIGAALGSVDADAWFAVGFNIFGDPEDKPVERHQKVSEARSRCVMSDLYSKAFAVRNGIFLGFHGARDFHRKDASRMALPKGVYLAHLKFAGTLEEDGQDAGQIAAFPTTDPHSLRIIREASDLPTLDTETALDEAYTHFSQGFGHWKRNKPHLFVVPRLTPTTEFRLPPRFRGLF